MEAPSTCGEVKRDLSFLQGIRASEVRACPIRVRRGLYLCEGVRSQGCASETAIGVSHSGG